MNRMDDQVQNFARAFCLNGAGCYETCNCGKIFYDSCNVWDWNDGEFEALQANKNAVACDYAIERFEIEGRYFVPDCNCWHNLAKNISRFSIATKSESENISNLNDKTLKSK